MIIICAGVIGSGKSSLTELLHQELGTPAYFEPVSNNPILPLFYKGNKLVENGTWSHNPYAFLLQIYFLNNRFRMIKQAMKSDNSILDRSIYEDKIFMKMNKDEGHATEEEWQVYQNLLNNMMEEYPKFAFEHKSPDLLIYLKVNYLTMIKHIQRRGRQFEQIQQDPSLTDYYKNLLEYYDQWINSYSISPVLVINGDQYDFVNNHDDQIKVLNTIEAKLVELGKLSNTEFKTIKENRYGREEKAKRTTELKRAN